MNSSFESVQKLSTKDQQSLVLSGDEPERVWATWALALKNVPIDSMPVNINDEPSSGVRLNLVVLVAAAGDKLMLKMLASNDPDSSVRASACQYLVKLSPSKEFCDPFLESKLYSNEADKVKARILSECTIYHVRFNQNLIESLIKSGGQEVRSLIVENLQKILNSYDLVSMLEPILIPALICESDVDVWNQLYDLCRFKLTTSKLMNAVSNHCSTLRLIVAKIKSLEEVVLWRECKSLVNTLDLEIQSLLLEVIDSENSPDCIQWALSLVNRALKENICDYVYLQSNIYKLLSVYSGELLFSTDAEELMEATLEEIKNLSEANFDDWDVEEEIHYLERYLIELSKWNNKEN